MSRKKVLVAFFPVLHDGYIALLKKEDWETVYWFPENILENWERYENLKRDLRWSDLAQIPSVISVAGIVATIKKITEEEIAVLQNFDGDICMPDEDVSRWFAETYIPDVAIQYEHIYLRADFSHVTKKDFVDPDAIITNEELHKEFMSKAQELKDKSPDWWRQIAALAVLDGKIIASACNHGLPSNFDTAVFGDPRSQFDAGESIEICSCIHAEASVVAQVASSNLSLQGADMYVTVFPCPVCAKLLSETGVRRVFYKEGYSKGEGKEVLQAAGIQLVKVA